MADSKPPVPPTGPTAAPGPTPTPTAATVPPKQNPAFKAMGLPNLRAKLPSRNWLIFFSVVGAWSGLVIYDRRQKTLSKNHWIRAVAPLAEEPMSTMGLPRKVTVYLSAPPGDGLVPAREVWAEYVKPVLVAAAVDYEVVEARREGGVWREVRDGVFRVRRELEGGEEGEVDAVEELRKRAGVQRVENVGGSLVIGRHTWKEWVRGIEEGWLSDSATINLDKDARADLPPIPRDALNDRDLPAKRTEYLTAPVVAVACPNILGFLNFPWRIKNFLTQRYLADSIGREVAALCLAVVKDGVPDAENVLKEEEIDWPKSVWKVEEPPAEESKPEATEDKKDEAAPEVTVTEDAAPTDTEKPEEKKAAEKKPEKKFVSPGIWREEMRPNSRILEALRRFELPEEWERRPEDFKWW